MICNNCGKQLNYSDKVCTSCGTANNNLQGNSAIKKEKSNNLCLIGFITGMVSIIINLCGVTGIISIMFSAIGINQVKQAEQKGEILGWIGIGTAFFSFSTTYIFLILTVLAF